MILEPDSIAENHTLEQAVNKLYCNFLMAHGNECTHSYPHKEPKTIVADSGVGSPESTTDPGDPVIKPATNPSTNLPDVNVKQKIVCVDKTKTSWK